MKNANNKKQCSSNSIFLKLHEISMNLFALEAELEDLEANNKIDTTAWEKLKTRYDELIEMGDNLCEQDTTAWEKLKAQHDGLIEIGDNLWAKPIDNIFNECKDNLCNECKDNLTGKPKLNVEGAIFCFNCAKIEVKLINNQRIDLSRKIYEQSKQEYEQKKATHQKFLDEWYSKRNSYFDFGVIRTILLYTFLSNQRKKEEAEFYNRFPMPQFFEKEPSLEYTPASYNLIESDGSSLKSQKNLRNETLMRDGFTCQCCGKKEESSNLEAHHILPASSGGLDEPTNLITLCIYCHDREDWFGHVRKYHTTIYTYVAARNSKIYHHDFCNHALKISKTNLITFKSLKEAKAQNYRPCYLCRPNIIY